MANSNEEFFYQWLKDNHCKVDVTDVFLVMRQINEYGNRHWWSNNNNIFSVMDADHIRAIKKKIVLDKDFKYWLNCQGGHMATKTDQFLGYYAEYLSAGPQATNVSDPMLAFFKVNDIDYTDLRSKGYSLWVPGGHELDFAVETAASMFGVTFKHIRTGHAYVEKEGWYTFDNTKAAATDVNFQKCMVIVNDNELRELKPLTKRQVITKVLVSGKILCIVTVIYRNSDLDGEFLTYKDYARLKGKGTVLGHILTLAKWNAIRNTKEFKGGLYAQSSILNQLGYSVNKQAGLSDFDRQRIISFAIKEKLVTKKDVINLLSWLSYMASKKDERNGTDNMARSILLWDRDCKFVEETNF